VIGRDADVRGAVVDQATNRMHHAAHRGHVLAGGVLRRGQRVEVPEEFVSAVDEMHVHAPSIPGGRVL
jgi:TolB-like protein